MWSDARIHEVVEVELLRCTPGMTPTSSNNSVRKPNFVSELAGSQLFVRPPTVHFLMMRELFMPAVVIMSSSGTCGVFMSRHTGMADAF
jgi:hypothetical protein